MDSYREIENLMYTYAERLDLGDLEGVAELFRNASIGTPGDDGVQGYDGVLSMYQGSTRLYEDGTPKTRHVTTNIIIEVDEADDSATARAYFTVLQCTDSLPLQPIIAGRYHDRFARADGRWEFRRRTMFTDQLGDLSQHLLFEL